MKRLKRWLAPFTRPITYLPLVAIAAAAAWFLFFQGGRAIQTPANNLLKNPSFEQLDARGIPAEWNVTREGGTPAVAVSAQEGYEGKHSLSVGVSQYRQGAVMVISPKVAAHKDTRYFFSASYRAQHGFDLVAFYYFTDGIEKRQVLEHYPGRDTSWSSMSAAVLVPENVTEVAFGIVLSRDGTVDLDAASVVKNPVATLPAACTGDNLITNAQLQTVAGAWPQGWEPFQYGDNQTVNQLIDEDHNIYASSAITVRKDGQAKWVFVPVEVSTGRYCYSLDYKATVSVDVMARFILKDGTTQYKYIGTLPASGVWTRYVAFVDAPANVRSVQVAPELTKVGRIDSDNYTLSRAE